MTPNPLSYTSQDSRILLCFVLFSFQKLQCFVEGSFSPLRRKVLPFQAAWDASPSSLSHKVKFLCQACLNPLLSAASFSSLLYTTATSEWSRWPSRWPVPSALEARKVSSSLRLDLTITGVPGLAPCPSGLGVKPPWLVEMDLEGAHSLETLGLTGPGTQNVQGLICCLEASGMWALAQLWAHWPLATIRAQGGALDSAGKRALCFGNQGYNFPSPFHNIGCSLSGCIRWMKPTKAK